jgi:hypothetical protein
VRAVAWSTRALHVLDRLVLPGLVIDYMAMTNKQIYALEAKRIAEIKAIPRDQLRRRVLKGLRKCLPNAKHEPPYKQLLSLPKCGHGVATEVCSRLDLSAGPALTPKKALQIVYDTAFSAAAFDRYGEGCGYAQDEDAALRKALETVRKRFGLRKGSHT